MHRCLLQLRTGLRYRSGLNPHFYTNGVKVRNRRKNASQSISDVFLLHTILAKPQSNTKFSSGAPNWKSTKKNLVRSERRGIDEMEKNPGDYVFLPRIEV